MQDAPIDSYLQSLEVINYDTPSMDEQQMWEMYYQVLVDIESLDLSDAEKDILYLNAKLDFLHFVKENF